MSTPEAHPPTHVLADLAEGVLDDAQAGEVQAHVDQCATCQGTLAELAQVSVALRALPAELPIPEFVAARMSHALAAERSSGGDAGGSDAAESPDAGAGGGTVAWFRRRLPQGLAAAASVAVIGFAGYVAVESGGGDDSSGSGDAAVAEGQAGDGDDDAGLEFGTSSDLGRGGSPSPTEDPPAAADDPYTAPPGTPEHVDPAEVTAAVEDVVQQRVEAVNETCGDDLSEELGLPVIGSTLVGSGVLVVLEDATTYDGWLLWTCSSRSNETLEPTVELPKTE
ncbi:anti-sigma factor family protein [Jiangella alkaliphila]|uniref:Zinc-finger n=1 Tax=Jiangella alkaliphila TaxID=419479 RepID=A0A1H2HLX6_9ACTN|nr:hypothetical protein [Jiangella alkaliphila]SDU32802.1 hypothetical protein SAMN04488563_1119 [Jiangella alkaliphila]